MRGKDKLMTAMHASFSSIPVLMFVIPEVFDGSKPTGDTGKLIQVIHNSLTHVQVIGVPCSLGAGGGKGGGEVTHTVIYTVEHINVQK